MYAAGGALVAAVIAAAIVGIVVARGGGGAANKTAATNYNALPGIRKTKAPWPPEYLYLADRLQPLDLTTLPDSEPSRVGMQTVRAVPNAGWPALLAALFFLLITNVSDPYLEMSSACCRRSSE